MNRVAALEAFISESKALTLIDMQAGGPQTQLLGLELPKQIPVQQLHRSRS